MEKKNLIISVGLALLALAGGLFFFITSKDHLLPQVSEVTQKTTTIDTSFQDTLDPETYEAMLMAIGGADSIAFDVTDSSKITEEAEDGTNFTYQLITHQKISILPTLTAIEYTDATVSMISDNASETAHQRLEELQQQLNMSLPSFYAEYNWDEQKITVYSKIQDTWIVEEGEWPTYDDDMLDYYHQWFLKQNPIATDSTTLQARDYEDIGTYTFSLDDHGDLTEVVYVPDETDSLITYTISRDPSDFVERIPETVKNTAIDAQDYVNSLLTSGEAL